jgi:hypothetical protein
VRHGQFGKHDPKRASNTCYATQIASLVTALKAVPEGGGTIFDNTIVFWCNEPGIGNIHSHTQLPLMIAAGKDTVLKVGQAVIMPMGTPHNRLLLNLIQATGVTGVTAFGDPKFGTAGPLAELMA